MTATHRIDFDQLREAAGGDQSVGAIIDRAAQAVLGRDLRPADTRLLNELADVVVRALLDERASINLAGGNARPAHQRLIAARHYAAEIEARRRGITSIDGRIDGSKFVPISDDNEEDWIVSLLERRPSDSITAARPITGATA